MHTMYIEGICIQTMCGVVYALLVYSILCTTDHRMDTDP